jgi:hypothetical protein
MQLDTQAANRDIKKLCGLRTIAVTAHERIKNVRTLNLSKG